MIKTVCVIFYVLLAAQRDICTHGRGEKQHNVCLTLEVKQSGIAQSLICHVILLCTCYPLRHSVVWCCGKDRNVDVVGQQRLVFRQPLACQSQLFNVSTNSLTVTSNILLPDYNFTCYC